MLFAIWMLLIFQHVSGESTYRRNGRLFPLVLGGKNADNGAGQIDYYESDGYLAVAGWTKDELFAQQMPGSFGGDEHGYVTLIKEPLINIEWSITIPYAGKLIGI